MSLKVKIKTISWSTDS